MRRCILLLSLTPLLQLIGLHSTGNYFCKRHVLLFFFTFAGMEYAYGHIPYQLMGIFHITIDRFDMLMGIFHTSLWSYSISQLIDSACSSVSILYAQVHILFAAAAASNYWEWRRREVRCNMNVVCRAFHIGRFADGLFIRV